jgi:hypothetical protein
MIDDLAKLKAELSGGRPALLIASDSMRSRQALWSRRSGRAAIINHQSAILNGPSHACRRT